MGCTTSHDAFAAAVTSKSSSRARARRASSGPSPRRAGGDPAALCRERVALIRAAADRRYALAAAHAAYFRSLAAVGDALRRFAASALAPATPSDGSASPVLTLPPSPAKPVATSASLPPSSSSSSTVSPLSHSDDDDDDDDLHLHDLDDDTRHGGGAAGGSEEASTSTSTRYHRHFMRRSPTVPTVVYQDPDAQAQYATAEASYGYAYGGGYSYGSAYPYGPYGEVIAGEAPEPAPRQPGPPPSPPAAEASPWEFLDPFAQYDWFVEDYAQGNLPTNSPNYTEAELRRMEGMPELELEDEDELERKAEKSKPSTSGVSDHNIKGKGPIQGNAASNGDFSGDSKLQKNATSKGDSSSAKLQRDATSISDSSGANLQRKGSEPPPDGKLQRKGSEPAADAEGEEGKPVSGNGPVPSNASSKNKEGEKKNTVSLKGTVSSDIDGSSTSGKKKGVAFDFEADEQPIRAAGGESHGKSVQSVVSSEPFSPLHHGTRDVREAIVEVKELFDQAANCSTDVSRLLEVGKMPPRDTPRVLRYISSRVMDPLGLTVSTSSCLPKSHGTTSRASSSQASTSTLSGAGGSNGIGHLSSTLEKLWFWEKKLYQEIKVVVLG